MTNCHLMTKAWLLLLRLSMCHEYGFHSLFTTFASLFRLMELTWTLSVMDFKLWMNSVPTLAFSDRDCRIWESSNCKIKKKILLHMSSIY